MYTVNELLFPEMFTSLTDPESSIMFSSKSTMDQVIAVIHFRDDVSYNMHGYNNYIFTNNYYLSQGTGVKPASYFLNLTSIDGTEELSNTIFATSITQDTTTNSTTLRASQSLPYRRLWKYQILALGCSEHSITGLFEISKCAAELLNLFTVFFYFCH